VVAADVVVAPLAVVDVAAVVAGGLDVAVLSPQATNNPSNKIKLKNTAVRRCGK
jgi:hypothetical protein